MMIIEQLLTAIPSATRADLQHLPTYNLGVLKQALKRGWRVTLTGRCWTMQHSSGGYIATTDEGLRFISNIDLRT